MATHSSLLAWRVPWTEEAGGLPSLGSQREGQLKTKKEKSKLKDTYITMGLAWGAWEPNERALQGQS